MRLRPENLSAASSHLTAVQHGTFNQTMKMFRQELKADWVTELKD